MTEPTESEIDAATLAYVGVRYQDAAEWRKRFPEAWDELYRKMRIALIAAAKVRGRRLCDEIEGNQP